MIMNFFNQLFGGAAPAGLQQAIAEGAFLVDVRTSGEFASGHVKGSVNIPLDQLTSNLNKFKNKKNTVVFCQSGGRSRQAKLILEQNGLKNITDGGSWNQVNQFVK
jgi:rhodanese-related sulfurtransferase